MLMSQKGFQYSGVWLGCGADDGGLLIRGIIEIIMGELVRNTRNGLAKDNRLNKFSQIYSNFQGWSRKKLQCEVEESLPFPVGLVRCHFIVN
jgi:hypothetical protein